MYTNFYVFRYAAVMVIIVAALLSTAAMFLKPAQERNMAIEKMKGVLAAANVDADADNAEAFFGDYIVREMVIDANGNPVSVYEDDKFLLKDDQEIRAFDLDIKKELYKKSTGKDFLSPLYIGEKDGTTLYIIPLLGKGLWGPVWGNIAFGSDMNTVVGVDFGHKGETPGLGAEIEQGFFTNRFLQKDYPKKIFDDNGNFMSISIVKGQAGPNDYHKVDAISGGTITCNGVSDMLSYNLENYVEFFKNKNK